MKLIIIAVSALVAVAIAAPAAPAAPAALTAPAVLTTLAAPAAFAVHAAHAAEQKVALILRSDFEQSPEGGYNYAIETDDGYQKQEIGELKTLNDEENKPHDVVIVRGSYSYVDPEGKPHSYTYTADQDGFQVESEDIPKAQ